MQDKISRTIKVYNDHAEEYDARHPLVMKEYADKFLSYLKCSSILDLGCGPGRDAKYFSEKGYEVTGIDLSAKFIEMAQKRAPRADFRIMDIRKLDFGPESFCGVWAFTSLLHIPKAEFIQTLKGIRKVLKPQGICYIAVKAGKGEKMVSHPTKFNGEERFFRYFEKEELINLVSQAGFELVETVKNDDPKKWVHIIVKATRH